MKRTKRTSAVVLLEVLLAIGVFAMSGVALVTALNKMAKVSANSRIEMVVQRGLRSLLYETGSFRTMEPGQTVLDPDEHGIVYTIDIEEVELDNEEGLLLQNMFLLRVTAQWGEGIGARERVAEVYRYRPMNRTGL